MFWRANGVLLPDSILRFLFSKKVNSWSTESTPSPTVHTCPVWPHCILPVCQNLFCFPCCHNISAAKSRDNQLQLCSCAAPAPDSCSPQIPCAMRPLSSQPTGYLAALLAKVKHIYSDIQTLSSCIRLISFFFNDISCWETFTPGLLSLLPTFLMMIGCGVTSGSSRPGKVTNFSKLKGGEKIAMFEKN